MKKLSIEHSLIAALLGVVVTGTALAQSAARMDPVPVKNWKVPSIETMMKAYGSTPIPNVTINPGAFVFQSLVPCRMVDTRGGPGPFGVGETRVYSVSFAGTCPGTLPGNIAAVSANFTVVNTAGTGFVTGFPTGASLPAVSTVNWIGANAIVSNAAIVPTGPNSNISVYASQATHVIIDINGIFISNITRNGDTLNIISNVPGGATLIGQNDSGAGLSIGVLGHITANPAGGSSAAVRGQNDGAGGGGIGVWGSQNGSGWGVYGTATSGLGVFGTSAGGIGILGTGFLRGVEGDGTDNTNSCGVCGFAASGGAGSSGVSAFPNGGTFPALFTSGNFQANGTKSFVEPHPLDASKQINYVSIEGPEPRTFFTGRARFDRGVARIEVPEHFRLVTDEEGLTVQITPIGAMAQVAVMDLNLNEITVQSSRNVEFFYTVTGIRSSFRDHQAVEANMTFRPEGTAGRHDIRLDLTRAARAAMIKNGTLNPDGSWNRETAVRMGWKVQDE